MKQNKTKQIEKERKTIEQTSHMTDGERDTK